MSDHSLNVMTHLEPLYTPEEVAEQLNWPLDRVVESFIFEPDVVMFTRSKKSLRIPASVVERVREFGPLPLPEPELESGKSSPLKPNVENLEYFNSTEAAQFLGINGHQARRLLQYSLGMSKRVGKWNVKRSVLLRIRERLLAHGGRCAICRESGRKMCIDHCHKTFGFRGILCDRCNTALGLFEDDPIRMQAAINYLRDWDK